MRYPPLVDIDRSYYYVLVTHTRYPLGGGDDEDTGIKRHPPGADIDISH